MPPAPVLSIRSPDAGTSSMASGSTTRTVCVDIPSNMSLCQGIGYKKMRLPNLMHHETLHEVSLSLPFPPSPPSSSPPFVAVEPVFLSTFVAEGSFVMGTRIAGTMSLVRVWESSTWRILHRDLMHERMQRTVNASHEFPAVTLFLRRCCNTRNGTEVGKK